MLDASTEGGNTGWKLSQADFGLALGAGLLGLFTGADELMDGLALLGRAANKLSPAKLVGKGLDIADKGFGALKTGAKALRDIGQGGLSQVDELAQTVSRFGRNAGQVADEVAAAAVDAGRLADNADEAALSLSRMDELMGERRVFSEAETRAAFSGGSDGALSNRLNSGCPGNSFTAGTPVETDEGQKPIEEIKVGDKVLAEDPETGEQGYFEVVALTNHPTDEVLRVTLDADNEDGDNEDDAQLNTKTDDDQPTKRPADQPTTMEITPDHPVYVEGKGWLWAENLAVGDRLRRADGGFAKVLAVERVELAEPELVYNFTVKGPHTYFVLEVGVLVHNDSCGDLVVSKFDWDNEKDVKDFEQFTEDSAKYWKDKVWIDENGVERRVENIANTQYGPMFDFYKKNPGFKGDDIFTTEVHILREEHGSGKIVGVMQISEQKIQRHLVSNQPVLEETVLRVKNIESIRPGGGTTLLQEASKRSEDGRILLMNPMGQARDKYLAMGFEPYYKGADAIEAINRRRGEQILILPAEKVNEFLARIPSGKPHPAR